MTFTFLALLLLAESPIQPDARIPNTPPPDVVPAAPGPREEEARFAPDEFPFRAFFRAGPEITGFFGPQASRVLTGAGWNGYFGVQGWHFLDIEAGYSGADQYLAVVPSGYRAPGPRYLRQGGQINVGVSLGRATFQPFVAVGLALTDYFTVGGGVSGLPIGFTVGLPLQIGFRAKFLDDHLLFDVRGTYVLESLEGAGASLVETGGLTNRWSTSLTAGYAW